MKPFLHLLEGLKTPMNCVDVDSLAGMQHCNWNCLPYQMKSLYLDSIFSGGRGNNNNNNRFSPLAGQNQNQGFNQNRQSNPGFNQSRQHNQGFNQNRQNNQAGRGQ